MVDGQFIIKTIAAIISGFCMGVERQMRSKPAGLKTNTLVSLGSCIFVLISHNFQGLDGVDNSRIVGQVIVGVGFLGAGVIMQHKTKDKVKGLATAATIWCSAASGCLAAFAMYVELAIFSGLVIAINSIFGELNQWIKK